MSTKTSPLNLRISFYAGFWFLYTNPENIADIGCTLTMYKKIRANASNYTPRPSPKTENTTKTLRSRHTHKYTTCNCAASPNLCGQFL